VFIRHRFSELIRVLRLTVVVVVPDTGSGGQAGTAEPVASLRRMKKTTAGAFVASEFQQFSLLRFQEEVAEGAKAGGAMCESELIPRAREREAQLGQK
jgi:hypothetical protein